MNQNPALTALWGGGYQSDEDKTFQAGTGSALKLGLNPNCTIKTFAYSTLTGQGNTQGNPAICITVEINGAEVNTRIYAPGHKVYFKGKEVVDQNSPDYLEGYKQQVALTKGIITHYLKGMGVTEAQLQAQVPTLMPGFEPLAQYACTLAATLIPTAKVDIFAHYQASIRSGSDRTFLEIPTDLAYGAFITPSTPGAEWNEVASFVIQNPDGTTTTKEGLAYTNQAGQYHRFARDTAFLKSKRATEQTSARPNTPGAGGTASPFANTGGAATPFANNVPPATGMPAPAQGGVSGWGG